MIGIHRKVTILSLGYLLSKQVSLNKNHIHDLSVKHIHFNISNLVRFTGSIQILNISLEDVKKSCDDLVYCEIFDRFDNGFILTDNGFDLCNLILQEHYFGGLNWCCDHSSVKSFLKSLKIDLHGNYTLPLGYSIIKSNSKNTNNKNNTIPEFIDQNEYFELCCRFLYRDFKLFFYNLRISNQRIIRAIYEDDSNIINPRNNIDHDRDDLSIEQTYLYNLQQRVNSLKEN